MRQNPKYQGRSDISLDHERRGTVWELSIEDREKAAAGLQVLGYDDDARILRAFNERLTRRAAMTVVPDDPRRRLKSTGDRPILFSVEGAGEEAEADPLEAAFAAAFDGLDRAARQPGLSLDQRAGFARLRAAAAAGAGRRPAEPA